MKPYNYIREYLTEEQLLKLTPQRRKALLQHVQAKVGKYIDEFYDFEPDAITNEQAKLNKYRKQIRRMVRKDESEND